MAARDALNYNIGLLDSDGLEFSDGAMEESIDYEFVPSGVDDCDAKE